MPGGRCCRDWCGLLASDGPVPAWLGDTNILISLERLQVGQLPFELVISTVTLAELSAGVHSAADTVERARRVMRVQRAEATFSPLPFDTEAARQYGIIAAQIIRMGRKPGQ